MGTTIEILLAFAGIMLGISLTITILNQFVSNIFGLRGSTLKWGLVTMLDELHQNAMTPKSPEGKPPVRHSDAIAEFVLTHPLISDSSTPQSLDRFLHWWRRATALQFGDLQRILQHSSKASVSDERLAISNAAYWTEEEARTWLSRNMVVTHDWFDASMARVSQRFSMKMRVSTAAFAFFLAFVLHINTFDLLRQLQANPSQVAAINAKLEARISELDPAKQSGEDLKIVNDLREQLRTSGIVIYPEEWTGPGDLQAFLGLLITGVLLSLGAPFWFNQLKNMSSLRSIVAQKADTAAATSAKSPLAVLSVTERNIIEPKV